MTSNDVLTVDGFLSQLESIFAITFYDSQEIIGKFHQEMRSGLAGENSSLKMIPSFVARPQGTEKGLFFTLDLGGTHIRILSVELQGNGKSTLLAISRFVIPKEIMCGTGEALFDFIADHIHLFFEKNNIGRQQVYDLAFTFSFTVEQHSINSGMLMEWTKGFTASGVESKDVVSLLSAALRRKGMEYIQVSALANDTVGTLVAKSYSDPSCDMGVILGTGTNGCYPEKIGRVSKCSGLGISGEMIINMEWGGFRELKTNIYDNLLDRASHNAGKQQLEKMISGMYLGEIARLVIVDMMEQGLLFRGTSLSAFYEEYILNAEHLSMIARGSDFFAGFGLTDVSSVDKRTIRKICRIVSERSARIAGVAIAAVITWMDANIEFDHIIAIDGSLFEKYPEYQDHMMEILHELFGDRVKRIKLELVREGSGIGSAIIGAMAASAQHPAMA